MFELGIQKNWIDALYARSSVRQYTGAPDKEQLDRLGETCRKLSWQGVKIRMFKGPGLKSQIKGTDVYAVIVAKRGTPMEVEGYMGEALVLEATSMGLGTCWLGAGFYPDIINRNVDLQTDEAVHCVISIGKVFIGESMFSRVPSASKIALIFLARYLQEHGGKMIDCQLETPHLKSMGGRYISYEEYMKIMNEE